MRHTHNIFIEKLRQRQPKSLEINFEQEIKSFSPNRRQNAPIQMEDHLEFPQIE